MLDQFTFGAALLALVGCTAECGFGSLWFVHAVSVDGTADVECLGGEHDGCRIRVPGRIVSEWQRVA